MNKYITPQEASDRMLYLSEESSRLSEEYADLEEKKLVHFTLNRSKHKSDKACDRAWEGTPDGIRAMRLKIHMKSIEKELSVIKTFLRHEENKARNIY